MRKTIFWIYVSMLSLFADKVEVKELENDTAKLVMHLCLVAISGYALYKSYESTKEE